MDSHSLNIQYLLMYIFQNFKRTLKFFMMLERPLLYMKNPAGLVNLL